MIDVLIGEIIDADGGGVEIVAGVVGGDLGVADGGSVGMSVYNYQRSEEHWI